jgi:integrase
MRARHQDGWVEERRGRRSRSWYGHYFEYVKDAQGKETRIHRGIRLGDKATMTKWKAEEKLRAEIGKTQKQKPVGAALTFEWFTRQQFLPMKQPKWTGSTRRTNLATLEHHVLPALGPKPLAEITKFDCQILVNDLAGKGYSHSIVDHCRIMVGAIMEEALDAELIGKNVARKVENPETKEPQKPVLPKDDARKLIDALPFRDRLICMIGAFCAMRPGEIFGLQRSSFCGDHFQIQGTAWAGTLRPGKAKTKGSLGSVAIPNALLSLLHTWLETLSDAPDGLLFPSSQPGRPMRAETWLRCRLKPVAERLGITTQVNFQVMRRSFATHAQGLGDSKSVQTHLRHSRITTTMDTYTQPVEENVRALVNRVADSVMAPRQIEANQAIN